MDLSAYEYEMSPYATTDGYDQIYEVTINEDATTTQLPPKLPPLRLDSFPIIGYSALTSTEQTAPAVYCRMDPYEKPADECDYEETKQYIQETIVDYEKSTVGLSKYESHEATQPNVSPYLTLVDDSAADISSDDEIPSSYLQILEDN